MRPSQVLDCHADLLTRLEDYPEFRDVLGMSAALDAGADDHGSRNDLHNWTQVATRNFINVVRNAAAYSVTPDMTDLVQLAAASLDGTDQFDKKLAPASSGIVHFEKGLRFAEVRGGEMIVNWIVWGPTLTNHGPATMLWMLNDAYTEPDQYSDRMSPEARRMLGRWSHVAFKIGMPEQRVGPKEATPDATYIAEIQAKDAARRAKGYDDHPVLPPIHPASNPLRLVLGLWIMLGQTITTLRDEDADRPTRRRMGRKNLPSRVTVIALRRREEGSKPADGESQIEYRHRWIVGASTGGHLAWRHCGPDHPAAQPYNGGDPAVVGWGVRCWIMPYVKGPADAPFVQTDKVYVLKR